MTTKFEMGLRKRGELFFTAQRIKCKTFVDVSHNQWRLHAHLNCDPLTGFGKVIE